MVCRLFVKSAISISQLQSQALHFVRRAEKEGAITIERRGKTVAFLVSRERMEAIIETLDIMGNSTAMKAICDHRTGK